MNLHDSQKAKEAHIMEQALKQAVESYSELSGIDSKQVATECLKEGPIREAVTLLLFSQAKT